MQELIEEAIRWLGYVVLRLVTVGRYVGGSSSDRLPEGAVGLVVIAVGTYVVVKLSTQSG